MILLVIDEGSIKGDRRLRDALKLYHTLLRHIERLGNLRRKGIAPQILVELARNALHLINELNHMHWHVNSACMFSNSPADRLTNPPGGIGAKAEAAPWIELLYSPN